MRSRPNAGPGPGPFRSVTLAPGLGGRFFSIDEFEIRINPSRRSWLPGSNPMQMIRPRCWMCWRKLGLFGHVRHECCTMERMAVNIPCDYSATRISSRRHHSLQSYWTLADPLWHETESMRKCPVHCCQYLPMLLQVTLACVRVCLFASIAALILLNPPEDTTLRPGGNCTVLLLKGLKGS